MRLFAAAAAAAAKIDEQCHKRVENGRLCSTIKHRHELCCTIKHMHTITHCSLLLTVVEPRYLYMMALHEPMSSAEIRAPQSEQCRD
jgi:hypothetical protein